VDAALRHDGSNDESAMGGVVAAIADGTLPLLTASARAV
jgi:hypothetical protein